MKLTNGILSSALCAYAFSNLVISVNGSKNIMDQEASLFKDELKCCPPGAENKKRPFNNCISFYQCAGGQVVPGVVSCAQGTVFHGGFCVNRPKYFVCSVNECSAVTAHLVVCGKKNRCKAELDNSRDNERVALDDELHEVRCCADDKVAKGWSFKKNKSECTNVYGEPKNRDACVASMTFMDAASHCEALDARLCSRDELTNNCVANRGCPTFNNQLIWSSDQTYNFTVLAPTTSPTSVPTFDPTSASTSAPTLVPTSAPTISSSGDVSDQEITNFLAEVSAESDVGAIQSIVKSFAEIVKSTPSCYSGTALEVSTKCVGHGCCTAPNSCRWEGNATVCNGACVGPLACNHIPTNSIIMEGSCNGAGFCENMGNNSASLFTTTATTTTDESYVSLFMARASCVSTDSLFSSPCQDMGAASNSVIVGSGSCIGPDSCRSFGEKTKGAIFVDSQSCSGSIACIFLAQTTARAADIKIGFGACSTNEACSGMASLTTSLESINIAPDACVGQFACIAIGAYAASSITIGGNHSCLGLGPCSSLGTSATGNIMIGEGSCRGEYSCSQLGATAANVAVGSDSCLAPFERCISFGALVSGADVAVQDGVRASGAEGCTADKENDCSGIYCETSFVMVANGCCRNSCV